MDDANPLKPAQTVLKQELDSVKESLEDEVYTRRGKLFFKVGRDAVYARLRKEKKKEQKPAVATQP